MTSLNSLSPSATAAATTQASGYWDNPVAPHSHDHNGATPDSVQVQVDATAQGAGPEVSIDAPAVRTEDGAVAINGGASNVDDASIGRTPDGKPIQIEPLHSDSQVDVARERTLASDPQGYYVTRDQVVFTTKGDGDDKVGVTQRDDGTLSISLNGESYELSLSSGQELTLRTGAGNDTIEVAPNVKINIVLDAGDGDNNINIQGDGDNRVTSGDGDDVIHVTGAGRNDIHTTGGTNEIRGGSGVNVIYGGDGNDTIYAGSGTNFIQGSNGDDVIYGGGKQDILSGGNGDDKILLGNGQSTVYTGAGADAVEGAKDDTKVYAEVSDLINSASGTRPTVINVEIDSSVGNRGLSIEGSDAFVQRMQTEIDFLRSSPNGKAMLEEFDKAAENKGNFLTLKELSNEDNGYAQTFSGDADIINGRPGAGGDVTINFNPSFHMDEFPAPTVVLFHEMSHAYNGLNGTFLPGTYFGEGPDSGRVPNAERQAVGLETSANPYDFDGTGPLTHNPINLTENGIRRELGLPDRPSYAL